MIGIPSLLQLSSDVADALKGTWAQMTELFLAQHDEDGAHTDITARSLTLTAKEATGASGDLTADGDATVGGDGVFGGKVEAFAQTAAFRSGFGNWGVLAGTGNGVPGALIGGVAHGFLFEAWPNIANSPFDPGSELRVWNLEQSTVRAFMRLGIISGVPTMIDGGSGASLALGDAVEPLLRVTTSTLALDGANAGEWTVVAFNAGDFTASAGTWTVVGGNVLTLRWMRVKKTLWLSFAIVNTNVSNAGVTLRIALPGGATVAATTYNYCRAIDAGAAEVVSVAVAPVGQTFLELYATAAAGTFANTGANNTTVSGMAIIEVS